MKIQPDVVELRQFYSSPLGICVRRDVGQAIERHWQEMDGVMLAGLGFPLPYLRRFLGKAKHVIPLMFPHLGAMYWPADISNHVVLAAESELPLPDNNVGRLLVCHAAEHSAHLATLLAEIYRVLLPGGRALLIVPNRRGLWSSRSNNPFGYGHPYHLVQIKHRAELAGLTFISSSTALFYLPSQWRFFIRISTFIEQLGQFITPALGGVLLVEVEKQLYASIPEPVKKPLAMPLLHPAEPNAAY